MKMQGSIQLANGETTTFANIDNIYFISASEPASAVAVEKGTRTLYVFPANVASMLVDTREE